MSDCRLRIRGRRIQIVDAEVSVSAGELRLLSTVLDAGDAFTIDAVLDEFVRCAPPEHITTRSRYASVAPRFPDRARPGSFVDSPDRDLTQYRR